MRPFTILSLSTLLLATPAIAANDAPVDVMIVGGFHMTGGHDMHNVQVDDVLAPKRQAEIQAVVDGAAKFKPTAVDVEWDEPYTSQKYADFQAGKLPPSHNEVIQLGFRLAKQQNIAVHGIDVMADFPTTRSMLTPKRMARPQSSTPATCLLPAPMRDRDAGLQTRRSE